MISFHQFPTKMPLSLGSMSHRVDPPTTTIALAAPVAHLAAAAGSRLRRPGDKLSEGLAVAMVDGLVGGKPFMVRIC